MTGKPSFPVALAGFYGLLGGVTALLYAALWATLEPAEKQLLLRLLEERAGVAIFILLLMMVALGMIFEQIYRRYVGMPGKLGEQVRVMLGANYALRLQPEGTPEMRGLAAAINELADQRDALQRDVLAKIRDAQASVETEKNRFAALMSELSQSVIVCNLDGRILLYNNRARQLFETLGEGSQTGSGGALIGLGRSIFAIIERSLINHALDKIHHQTRRGATQPVANFVTSLEAQLIRVQMAPVLGTQQETERSREESSQKGERAVSGYVLILDNITRAFEIESRRDLMLQLLTEGGRASLANVRAAVENLLAYPDMEAYQRDRFIGIMRDEVDTMSRRLNQTVTDFSDAIKVRWPLEEMRGADLIDAARRHIEQHLGLPTKIEDIDDEVWIKTDSFSLLQALTYVSVRLKEEFKVREVRFRLARAGRLAHLDLIWTGTVIGSETLMAWELEPMHFNGESSTLTLREVAERHGGELWFQRDKPLHRSFFRILIPATATPEASHLVAPHGASRPEYYDFDLFRRSAETHALDDRLLTQLTYTVFDTETTGLEPSAGDEIIQIGATRIVNGRLLRNETYEQLIDPRRPIAPESIRIHGISRDILEGQPTIDRILPDFHAFCEDTVLVAHNAAFDMRFLQMKEQSSGVIFHQPLLDTLLLSAVIHPNQDSHRLEAIAERLGINVIGRHTALGDAIVTGEIFLKMIPLLAEQGIKTLREAREASERTYYAKAKY
ncbi:MAG: DNA polymerase III subunit epsilon [Burkholderiales bacterium RIFCSPLOWO2_02_FULL_57_36]|nr:MAG: DNA polymerase III subunit epsilon [Burkholderiales bacterium RIFCSPLOWO2_02_FULL_57_36]